MRIDSLCRTESLRGVLQGARFAQNVPPLALHLHSMCGLKESSRNILTCARSLCYRIQRMDNVRMLSLHRIAASLQALHLVWEKTGGTVKRVPAMERGHTMMRGIEISKSLRTSLAR